MSNPYVPDPDNHIGSEVRRILEAELPNTWMPPQSIDRSSVQHFVLSDSLPDSPDDGEEFVHEPADGVVWKFRYNASSDSDYKWEFIGGAALFDEVDGDTATNDTTTSTTPTDLTIAGPSVTIPFDGEYEVTLSVNGRNTTAGSISYAAVKIGTAATSEYNAGVWLAGDQNTTGATTDVLTCEADDVLLARYWVSANTGGWKHRRLRVLPVRVG